ncbi:MAG: hypothetical protein ACRDSZ_10830 [Pseudonocardiaceae bacterium]
MATPEYNASLPGQLKHPPAAPRWNRSCRVATTAPRFAAKSRHKSSILPRQSFHRIRGGGLDGSVPIH